MIPSLAKSNAPIQLFVGETNKEHIRKNTYSKAPQQKNEAQ